MTQAQRLRPCIAERPFIPSLTGSLVPRAGPWCRVSVPSSQVRVEEGFHSIEQVGRETAEAMPGSLNDFELSRHPGISQRFHHPSALGGGDKVVTVAVDKENRRAGCADVAEPRPHVLIRRARCGKAGRVSSSQARFRRPGPLRKGSLHGGTGRNCWRCTQAQIDIDHSCKTEPLSQSFEP